jgi:hypothetical protein
VVSDKKKQKEEESVSKGTKDMDTDKETVKEKETTEAAKKVSVGVVADPKTRKRGARMFAGILGTLSKFKKENNQKSEAVIIFLIFFRKLLANI